MKIGLVLDDSLDSSDGVQQYVLTLGKWLSSQHHEVHYLVGQTDRKDIENVHSLAKNIGVRFNKNILRIPLSSSSSAIKTLLQKEQYDVLHVQLPFSPQLAGKIIKYADSKTAVVGTFHILPYSSLQFAGAKVLSWLTGRTLKRFNAIVSVSPGAKEFAKKSMGIESTVLPNAVDLSAFRMPKKANKNIDGTKRIVFLGRLVQRKGCRELLMAIKQLADQDKLTHTKVTIAGDGPDRQKLESYVRINNLSRYVEFTGRISEQSKPELLANADIVALPSISGESFGIVVVEAIASGAGVVVGGDNPGYSFVLADTPEVLIDPLDTSRFADLLFDLLSNDARRRQLGASQRASIARFDVAVIGPQILGVYKEALPKAK